MLGEVLKQLLIIHKNDIMTFERVAGWCESGFVTRFFV